MANRIKLNLQDCIEILNRCNVIFNGPNNSMFRFENEEDAQRAINLMESYVIMNKLIE